MSCRCLRDVFIVLAVAAVARVEADDNLANRLPRIPPTEPNKALSTFEVRPGFRIELVAAEPLVTSPVAIDFDARGRLFVVEMRDYSEQDRERLGRVRLLEDTDHDGRFDKSHVFADDLSWPTAVLCYGDGVFVGASPDILFLRDTDGDGRCDQRETVITGLGRTNVQGLVNSFRWGLDNRVNVAASSCGGELRVVGKEAKVAALSIRGRDFSFDPRTFDLRAETGGAQHGMCFDDIGRKFVCSNSNHIQLVMIEDRYLARNRFLAAPSPLANIAADGPAAEVYRISPVEPWRVVRTELRLAGKVPGPIEGGGRAAGYFTSATGITIYRGDAWPEEFREVAIVGDVGSNLIHRKRLSPDGLGLVARRIDEKSEFVASRDIWFRPVQFANGPDGALYVLDMYREVIEHPASLPPEIKRHIDLTSGRDRGRIYRIVPDGFTQPKRRAPAELALSELVRLLAHPNAWHRETAARLLFERRDAACVELVREMAAADPSPLCRMHALYVLDGLNALRPSDVIRACKDPYPGVRRHAVRLAERVAGDSPELQSAIANLANDPDIQVRYQVALTLGGIKSAEATAALAHISRSDAAERWMRVAVVSSSLGRAGKLLEQIVSDSKAISDASVLPLVEMLARQAGLEADAAQVSLVSDAIQRIAHEPRLGSAMLRALGTGLSQARSPLAAQLRDSNSRLGKQVAALVNQAQIVVRDADRPPGDRAAAIETLSLDGRDRTAVLTDLLNSDQPTPVVIAALRALGRSRDTQVATRILERWPGFSPTVRTEAIEALFARPERLVVVLAALERGELRAADLDSSRVKQFLEHRNEAIRKRAAALFQTAQGRRDDVVKSHADVLKLSTDAERGRTTFRKVCSACHRADGVGHNTGPDLAAIKNRGPEAILLALLDPNREVNPQYLNYTLTTNDGRSATGMITAETATSVTLRRGEGLEETFLRGEIDQLRSTGLSLMPEGLEQQLSRQELADVIAYLLTIK